MSQRGKRNRGGDVTSSSRSVSPAGSSASSTSGRTELDRQRTELLANRQCKKLSTSMERQQARQKGGIKKGQPLAPGDPSGAKTASGAARGVIRSVVAGGKTATNQVGEWSGAAVNMASNAASAVWSALFPVTNASQSNNKGAKEEQQQQHAEWNPYGTHKGQGPYTDPDGGKYEGQWEDDKFHGKGTYTYPNGGGNYEGDWKENKKDGQGTRTYPDGGKYEGEWKDNNLHGKGTYTHPAGDVYDGQWKENKKDGEGTYTYPDGGNYEGQWKDDKCHGQGTHTYPNGNVFEGQWKENKKDGQGTYTYSDKAIFKGQWKKGKWDGPGTYTSANGGMLSVVVQDCYFTTSDGGSVLASRVAFERALAQQQQSTRDQPPSWGQGRGIAIIVADRLDGNAASRNEEYIKTVAQSMGCELRVLSGDTSPQGIRDFLGENARWLEEGTYVGLWFSGHGSEMTVECQGGESLDISELLSLVNRGDRPLLAFIDACRTYSTERVALSQSAAPALIRQKNIHVAFPTLRGALSFHATDDGSIWLEALADVAPHCADGKTTVTQLCSSARTHLDTLLEDRSWVQRSSDESTLDVDPWINAVFAPRSAGFLSDDSQDDGVQSPTLAVGDGGPEPVHRGSQ